MEHKTTINTETILKKTITTKHNKYDTVLYLPVSYLGKDLIITLTSNCNIINDNSVIIIDDRLIIKKIAKPGNRSNNCRIYLPGKFLDKEIIVLTPIIDKDIEKKEYRSQEYIDRIQYSNELEKKRLEDVNNLENELNQRLQK